jgi:F-type H+-transporting ATPase subunit alpha
LVEALNQDERHPVPIEDQVASIYSGTGGYLDRIKVERVHEFLGFLLSRVHSEYQELMDKIAAGEWDDSIEEQLGKATSEAIDDFGPDFDAEGNPLEEGESDRIRSPEERERGSRTEEADGEPQAAEEEPEQEESEQEAAPA